MATWACPVCLVEIVGCRQIAVHENLLKQNRCVPATPPPLGSDDIQHDSSDVQHDSSDSSDAEQEDQFTIRTSMLCRRSPAVRSRYKTAARDVQQRRALAPDHFCRDMTVLQDEWEEYLLQVASLYSTDFWNFFLCMHEQPGTAIDTSLTAVKRLFLKDTPSTKFPTRKQNVLARIRRLPSFLDQVTHTLAIDMTAYDLEPLQFTFLDPVWAWIQAADRWPADTLHWVPREQLSGGDRLYGGGVQYGESFAAAYGSCPEGAFPMLINLHWDGTSAHGLPATPVVIGVCNLNTQSTDAHICVGYIPTCDRSNTEAKFHIRQKCIGAILSVLEISARTGVTCRLRDHDGTHRTRTLFPRLMAMTLDQPEAQLYFGLLNKTSCLDCRRRKGRSAHRSATFHDADTIKTLYNIVQDPNSAPRHVTLARQRLTRHGFNPERRCTLPQICKHLLIVHPDCQELFPNVGKRDRMHAAMIFLHRTVSELFQRLPLSSKQKRVLDQRLIQISMNGCMRDENTGRSYRVQQSLFSDVNMSARDRVCAVFFIPHVLGHEARIIPNEIRSDLLRAVAQAQQMLIAFTGHRSYSKRELEVIFDEG